MNHEIISMDCKTCEVCGAKWIAGQHYWSGTGNKGNELDLAGLVCNNVTSDKSTMCVNPKKGVEGGDTWSKRLDFINHEMERKEKRERGEI